MTATSRIPVFVDSKVDEACRDRVLVSKVAVLHDLTKHDDLLFFSLDVFCFWHLVVFSLGYYEYG